jgi:hypothetical protein
MWYWVSAGAKWIINWFGERTTIYAEYSRLDSLYKTMKYRNSYNIREGDWISRPLRIFGINNNYVPVENFIQHHGIVTKIDGNDIRITHFHGEMGDVTVHTVSFEEFMDGEIDLYIYQHGKDLKSSVISAKQIEKYNTQYNGNYNLITNNCEHFVTKCIFGEGKSRQIGHLFDAFSYILKYQDQTIAAQHLFNDTHEIEYVYSRV